MKVVQRLLTYVVVCAIVGGQYSYGQNDIELFQVNNSSVSNQYLRSEKVNGTNLSLKKKALKKLNKSQPLKLNLNLPISKKEALRLNLKKNQILSDGFRVTIESEYGAESVHIKQGIHYSGHIEGEKQSMVSISIFENEIMGVVSYDNNNYNLEKVNQLTRNADSDYIFYKEKLKDGQGFECHTKDEFTNLPIPDGVEIIQNSNIRNSVAPTVDIYMECDYKMFVDKGSNVATVSNFTTGLFNVIATIFSDGGSGPDLNLSEIKVWTTVDPYGATVFNSSSAVLGNFSCNVPTYNGRIAHLLSTSTKGLGGIAELPSCPGSGSYTSSIYGFSNISQNYNSNLNNYSWTVNVLAHELGHNLGSPHTHACFWNGNSTQIDDCGNKYFDDQVPGSSEGNDCYNRNSPIIPNEGSIMSYCHLYGNVGIDLAAGFHSQVATQILQTANCLSATSSGCASASYNDLSVSDLTSSTINLNCNPPFTPDWYYWGYKLSSSTSWEYSPSPTQVSFYEMDIVLDESYDFVVNLYCNSSGWSGFSCVYSFVAGETSCEDNMDVTYDPIANGTYEANNQISSAGIVEGQVVFDAMNEIVLNGGFEVRMNGEFTAMIDDGCGGNNFREDNAQRLTNNQRYQTAVIDRGEQATSANGKHAVWYKYHSDHQGILEVIIPSVYSKRSIQIFSQPDGNITKDVVEIQTNVIAEPDSFLVSKSVSTEKGNTYWLVFDDSKGNAPIDFEFVFTKD